MRTLPKAIVATIAAGGLALSLAACSTSSDPAASSSSAAAVVCADSGTESDSVKVTGEFGKDIKATFDTPLTAESTQLTQITEGSGTAAASGDTVTMSYAIYNGTSGDLIDSIGDTDDATVPFVLDATQLLPGMVTAFSCAKPGSEAVAVIPAADAFGDTGSETLGIAAGDSLVVVFKVSDVATATPTPEALDVTTLPQAATGEPQEPVEGFPTVVLADDGEPTITIPSEDPPTDLQVEVLKKGDGDTVTDTSTVYVQYTGVVWKTGEVFDSSWSRGEVSSFPVSGVITGFKDGLVGQTVGSQVVIVIPPDQGYGDTEQSTIPANSTLVFVVDIVAIQ